MIVNFLTSAVEVFQNGCDASSSSGCSQAGSGGLSTTATTVVNTLLEVIGIVCVIMVVVGGLKLVLSSGDPKRVESARNTILYAIIGLLIASLAFAIIHFVVAKV